MSVDKIGFLTFCQIGKLVSFVDTWESDRSDFFPCTCRLSYTWSTKSCPPFPSNQFSFPVTFLTESRPIKMTAKFSSKNHSSSVMLASIYPIIMCRGFSGNRRWFLIKPMFCCLLIKRQIFVWLQLRCWCSLRLFPVGVKTAYPETK